MESFGGAPLASLCPPQYPTSHAFRLPHEQAQEASQFSPTPPALLDELGPESLSWCVWGKTYRDPDTQFDQEAEKDINVRLARIAVEQARNALANALTKQTETKASMNPTIGWQMAKGIAAAEAVKACEQQLADRERELNQRLNEFTGMCYAAQLQAKRDAEAASVNSCGRRSRLSMMPRSSASYAPHGKAQGEKEGEDAYPRLRKQYLEQQALANADNVSRLGAF